MTKFKFVIPKSIEEFLANSEEKELSLISILYTIKQIADYQRWKWIAENKDEIVSAELYRTNIIRHFAICFNFKDGISYMYDFDDMIKRKSLKRKFRKFGIPYKFLPAPSTFYALKNKKLNMGGYWYD